MIILHNHLSRESRNFVLNVATETDVIVDWYNGGREEWFTAGEIKGISSFPSVIVDIPEYNTPANEELEIGITTVPASRIAIREPTSIADIEAFLEEINVTLRLSESANKTVADLTLESLPTEL